MTITKEKYIVNKNGKPVQVILDISVFEKILEELEELDCIRTYDDAKKKKNKAIPFYRAIRESGKKKVNYQI